MNRLTQINEYYESLRSSAEIKAADNLARARENNDFKAADDRLSGIEHDLAFAEIAGDAKKITALEAEKAGLLKLRAKILSGLNMKETDLSPDYKCKKCGDTGFIGTKKCDCFDKTLAEVALSGIGVSKEKLPSFETDSLKKGGTLELAYAKMKTFAEKFPEVKKKNVVLIGATGTGKTYLAGCTASAVIKKGYNAIMLSSFALNNIFLNYHSLFSADRQVGMDALINCDLLIIDDLGAEQNIKNVTVNYLLNLLNERNMRESSTIITTNLSSDEILSRYNERVYSRIFDKRLTAAMQLSGNDLRLIKQ